MPTYAPFGSGVFDEFVFGIPPTTTFDASPFTATPKGYSSLLLNWSVPAGTYSEMVLVRSSFGYPTTIYEGVTLLDETSGFTNNFLDTNLKSGQFYYYTLFVFATATNTWVIAGVCLGLVLTNFGTGNTMAEYLPDFYMDMDDAQGTQAQPAGPLRRFLDLIGWEFDWLRSEIAQLLNLYNIDLVRGDLLPYIGETFGISYEPILGMAATRRLLKNLAHAYKMKGTTSGVATIASSYTGFGAKITQGKNLEIQLDDSAGDLSVGIWANHLTNCTMALSQAVPAQHTTYQPSYGSTSNVIKVTAVTGASVSFTSSAAADIITTGIPVLPGDEIVLSAYFRAATSVRSWFAQLDWYNVNGIYLSSTVGVAVSDTTTGMTRVSVGGIAPTGAAYVGRSFGAAGLGANEVHYFDAEQVELVSAVWPIADRNLLSADDASFESGIGTWSGPSLCTVAQSSARAVDGTHSLAVTGTGSGSAQASTAWNGYSAVAGQSYTFVASVLANSTPRSCWLQLNFWSATTSLLGSSYGPAFGNNAVGWQAGRVVGTAPAGTVYVQVVLNIGGIVNAEVHYLDCAGLFLTAVPSEPQWAGINPNLLTNGDFEQDVSSWATANGASALARSTAQAYTGLASALVTVTNSAGSGASAVAVPTVIGQTYTASGWFYQGSLITGGGLQIAVADGATPRFGSVVTATGAWTRSTITWMATGTTATIYMGAVGTPTNGQQFYFDGVKLEVGSTATQFVPPSYSNLITNPSFETNLTGYTTLNGASMAASSAQALFGSQSCLVSGIAGTTYGGLTLNIYDTPRLASLTPGQTYTLSAYIYSPTAIPGGSLEFGGDAFGGVWTYPTIAPNTWTRVTCTGVLTAGTDLYIRANGGPSTLGPFYVDGVQIDIGNQANPYVDGSQIGGSWDAANAVYTQSFEDGTTDSWGVGGTVPTIANSTAQAKDGTHSLLVTWPTVSTPGASGAYIAVPVAPNTTYTFSAWVYIPSSGGPSGGVRLSCDDGVSSLGSTPATTVTGTWTRLSLTVTTNSLSVLHIVLQNGGVATSGNTSYIDAVQVEQREYATAYGQAASANASSSTYNYPWEAGGSGLVSSAVPTSWDPPRDIKINLFPLRQNYATNPSFEADVANWSFTNVTAPASAAPPHTPIEGTKAAELTATANGNVLATSAPITIPPNTPFFLSLYMLPGSTVRNFFAFLIWQLSVGGPTTVNGTAVAEHTGAWTRASVFGISPSNATGVQIGAQVTAAAAGEIHWLDAVLLEPSNFLNAFFDGNSTPSTDYSWEGTPNESISDYYPRLLLKTTRLAEVLADFIPVGSTFSVVTGAQAFANAGITE